jgi:hypothetical protein
MVWNQYVDEANVTADEFDNGIGRDFFDGDYEDEPPPSPMSLDDWTCWYSRDLMNMWMSLRQYREDASISNFVMPYASYSDFVEFCYYHSDGHANSYPS